MKDLRKGLVPAAKEPAQVFLSFKPAYLSRNEMRLPIIPEPRPVMFADVFGDTKPHANIGDAIASLKGDKDLPKGALMYLNGSYVTIKEALKLAPNLKSYHYKRAGRDTPTHKFQFWTDAAAAKFGLAYATETEAEKAPVKATKTKGATKARY